MKKFWYYLDLVRLSAGASLLIGLGDFVLLKIGEPLGPFFVCLWAAGSVRIRAQPLYWKMWFFNRGQDENLGFADNFSGKPSMWLCLWSDF